MDVRIKFREAYLETMREKGFGETLTIHDVREILVHHGVVYFVGGSFRMFACDAKFIDDVAGLGK